MPPDGVGHRPPGILLRLRLFLFFLRLSAGLTLPIAFGIGRGLVFLVFLIKIATGESRGGADTGPHGGIARQRSYDRSAAGTDECTGRHALLGRGHSGAAGQSERNDRRADEVAETGGIRAWLYGGGAGHGEPLVTRSDG
ncbi:protein of unknown function [Methylococcus capsulatus]|uniref:Uncharacterized protein n=1 Tax=Methylococcus capsulatus TaxID=414 RepID=A0AA35V1Q9_METCP|nr:protein of unknown function [Methylococcus capsulatus]